MNENEKRMINLKKRCEGRNLLELVQVLQLSAVLGLREFLGKLAPRGKNMYFWRLDVVTNTLKLLKFSRKELKAATRTSCSSLSLGIGRWSARNTWVIKAN